MIVRRLVFEAGLLLALSGAIPLLKALAADAPRVDLSITQVAPRELEETTQAAIKREYATAWKTLATALQDNRKDQLPSSFVGAAREQIERQIDEQQRNNLRVRYIDRGHKLEAVFYSPEGSAMQLHDTASLEKQYLDGSSVVHSEQVTQKYLVLMTVSEDRWKVRVLQELPR